VVVADSVPAGLGVETMRIGLVGLDDPRSIHSYSGTPYFMAQALLRRGCRIAFYLHLTKQNAALIYLKEKVIRRLTGKHVICERDPRIARHYPEQINRALREHNADAVLGTSSFYTVTQNSPVPSIFWGDTTVAGVIDQYRYYKDVTKRSLSHCHKLEQAALNSCSLAIFSNHWAADVARRNYSFDERKLRVIPYGANLFTTPEPGDVDACIKHRDSRRYELLFVGVDWQRKGAQIAIDAVAAMRALGAEARLTLVGCVPPPGFSLPPYVTLVPKVDKSTQTGQSVLTQLYAQSHLLILPSRAECAAVSLAEASTYAVPSLSTDVGGNSTLVKNGVNGYLFPLEAGPADYAEYALELLSDPDRYAAMCWTSYERARAELNWDVAVSRLTEEMSAVMQLAGRPYEYSPAS
jgi:glycosyltransferase involved in cell wall biosynthesis